MKVSTVTLVAALIGALLVFSTMAMAMEDHTEYIEGPFTTGEEVTAACLECHEEQAEDILKTSHWKWKGKPNMVEGMEKSKEDKHVSRKERTWCKMGIQAEVRWTILGKISG